MASSCYFDIIGSAEGLLFVIGGLFVFDSDIRKHLLEGCQNLKCFANGHVVLFHLAKKPHVGLSGHTRYLMAWRKL